MDETPSAQPVLAVEVDAWLGTTWDEVWLVMLSGAAIVVFVVAAVRVVGLRSFAKMSAFDFAVTVAIGSLIATTAATDTSLLNGALGVSALLITQWAIGRLRTLTPIQKIVDNRPLVLMTADGVVDEHLRRARLTEGDLHGKLRLAGLGSYERVGAVIMETTGDISVITTDDVDLRLLDNVIGSDLVAAALRRTERS